MKHCIHSLNEINLDSVTNNTNKILFNYNSFNKLFTAQIRSFRTSSKFNNDNDGDLDNLTYKSDQSL